MKRKHVKNQFAEQKQQYRKSKEWAALRKEALIHFGDINPLTGLPFSGTRTLHHKRKCTDIEDYESTDLSEFIVLQSSQHNLLHELARLKSKKGSPLDKIKKIIKPLIGEEWVK